MSGLLILPLAVPLFAAGVLLLTPYRPVVHRVIGLSTTAGALAVAGVLLTVTRDGRVPVERIGGWPAPVAISFAADSFAALMLAVTSTVILAGLAFAAASGDDRQPAFVPLVLVLSAGAYGSFLAADLFNLFVLIEVMLVPSYVLLNLHGGRSRLRAGQVYVTTNLLASTILISGVGLLYGVTGEVQYGELAGAARDSPAAALAGGVVLLALALKAAVVPLHTWLPRSYPHAPPAVTAIFSGLLTKVGLYAIIRIYAVVFDGDPALRWLIGGLALLTMVIGVLGAVGERTMRGVLSFHMVSQIGYILLGVAMFSAVSLAASVFYLVQYILVKAALFLCAGAVQVGYRTDRLSRLSGLVGAHPLLAVAFAGAALSLSGLPPFSGFLAKFLIFRAAATVDDWVSLTVAAVVSLLTLLSMLKIWSLVFWGRPARSVTETAQAEPEAETDTALEAETDTAPAAADTAPFGPAAAEAGRIVTVVEADDAREQVDDVRRLAPADLRPGLVLPAMALTVLSFALGLAAEPLLLLSDAAGNGLADPSAYVRAVTGR